MQQTHTHTGLLHLYTANLQPWISECVCPSVHFLLQCQDVFVRRKLGLKVLELLANLFLHLQRNLNSAVQEVSDLDHIFCFAAASGHSGRADTHTSWRESRDIASNAILV